MTHLVYIHFINYNQRVKILQYFSLDSNEDKERNIGERFREYFC